MSQQENQENNNNLDDNNKVNENNNGDGLSINNERNIEIEDNNNQSNNDQNIINNDENNQNINNQDDNNNNNQITDDQNNNNQNENNDLQTYKNSLENQNKEEEKNSKNSDENDNNIQNKNLKNNQENNNNKTENPQENESLLKQQINNEKNQNKKYKTEDLFSNQSDQNITNISIQDSKKKTKKIKSILTHEYTINPSLEKLPIIFYIYLFLIFLNVILVYIIKPFSTIFYFILFERFNNTLKDERDPNSKKKIKKVFIVIGYLIIFLLPTFHFFTRGIYILVHHKGYLYKVYIFIILCIEIYFNIPLTFLYEENYYSIFYFKQQGIEILLNPTLIFFPTDYMLSSFEIIRNLIESIYFFILTIALFYKIKDNIYQQFTLNFMIISMILYVSKFIGAIAMYIIKIMLGDSTKRPLKINHKIWLEFEDKTRKEKKKK